MAQVYGHTTLNAPELVWSWKLGWENNGSVVQFIFMRLRFDDTLLNLIVLYTWELILQKLDLLSAKLESSAATVFPWPESLFSQHLITLLLSSGLSFHDILQLSLIFQ